jgi:hypothetical protein
LWAAAGFLVSASWAFYFTVADKAKPVIAPVYALAELSQPAVGAVIALYPDLTIGVSSVVAANVATYALLGLIDETIRRRYFVINSGAL